MKLQNQINKFVFMIIIAFSFVQITKAEYRTVNDINQMAIDRRNIIEPIQQHEQEEKKYIEIQAVLSFYSTLNEENGQGSIDAQGNELKYGTIAIPRSIELGTKFQFDYFGDKIFTGTDRGSEKHIRIDDNGIYRIDVCIERPQGYSDSQYWQYVNDMGKIETKGKMFIE